MKTELLMKAIKKLAALKKSPLWIEIKTGVAEYRSSWDIASGSPSRRDRSAEDQERQKTDGVSKRCAGGPFLDDRHVWAAASDYSLIRR